jgi:hypothetical protein
MEPYELTNTQLKLLLKRLNLPTFGKTKIDFITTLQFAQETPEELDRIIEEILNSDQNAPIKKGRKNQIQNQNRAEISSKDQTILENSQTKSIEASFQIQDAFFTPFFTPFITDFQNYQACIEKQPKRFSQNAYNKRRYYEFRIAAYYIAKEFSDLAIIEKMAIIGSIARPLLKEPPLYKRNGDNEWHFSKDLDLAVWFKAPINQEILRELQEKRVSGLSHLASEMKITFAHHQVEIFCFDLANHYLGRVCIFKNCPKPGKTECLVSNCGKIPLLQQHQDFHFNPKTLTIDQIILIYQK